MKGGCAGDVAAYWSYTDQGSRPTRWANLRTPPEPVREETSWVSIIAGFASPAVAIATRHVHL